MRKKNNNSVHTTANKQTHAYNDDDSFLARALNSQAANNIDIDIASYICRVNQAIEC